MYQRDENLTDMKRNLLTTMLKDEYSGSFDLTKAVLLGEFFEPNYVTKRKFVSEGKLMREAADLNSMYYEQMVKRKRIHEVG